MKELKIDFWCFNGTSTGFSVSFNWNCPLNGFACCAVIFVVENSLSSYADNCNNNNNNNNNNKNFMTPFHGWGSTVTRLQSHYQEKVYFLPQTSQKVLVLVWSILEGWKAESILEPPSGFEPWTPGLGTQHPNH